MLHQSQICAFSIHFNGKKDFFLNYTENQKNAEYWIKLLIGQNTYNSLQYNHACQFMYIFTCT